MLVLLGPQGGTTTALENAQREARRVLTLRHQGVLTLLDVRLHDEQLCWVYSLSQSVASSWSIQGGEAQLPTPVAAEIVARAAEILLEVDPEIAAAHPGPTAADVLLAADGEVLLAGFVGPFPRPPGFEAPLGNDGESALVFRLGVLLARLSSGAVLEKSSERGAHESRIRRTLIRVMARPGPVVTDRFGDWLRGMLAWEPADRPPLATIPAGLRKVAAELGGAELRQWASTEVAELRSFASTKRRTPAVGGAAPGTSSGEVTREFESELADADTLPPSNDLLRHLQLGEFKAEDDPTELGPEAPPTEVGEERESIGHTSMDGPMPIHVGPPSEAMPSGKPTLPPGFLSDPATQEEGHVELTDGWKTDTAEVKRRAGVGLLLPILWVASTVLLIGIALLLLAFLLLWERPVSQPAGPSLNEVMDAPSDD